MRLSLFLLSPTLLTSFLVRPDEQVAQKYVLGRLFAWFEDVSSLLLLSPSNRLSGQYQEFSGRDVLCI